MVKALGVAVALGAGVEGGAASRNVDALPMHPSAKNASNVATSIKVRRGPRHRLDENGSGKVEDEE